MSAILFGRRLSVAAFFAAFLGAAAGTSQAGVVGWWKMDDPNYPAGYFQVPPSSTPDSGTHGNDATLLGNVTVGTSPGPIGNSAVFGTGGGALDAGTDVSLKPSGTAGYSFASWVKFDRLSGWQLVGSDWNDAGPNYFYHLGPFDATMQLYVVSAAGGWFSVADPAPLVADTWTHVAFTVTPTVGEVTGSLTLYRDGQAAGSVAYTPTSLATTAEPIILGAKTAAKLNSLQGQLDETAIWTSTISGGDVSALYNNTATPAGISPSTLGGYWTYDLPLPPPPTATVIDSSGGAHHGVTIPDGVDPFHPAGGQFAGAVDVTVCAEGINCGGIDAGDEEMTFATWIKPTDLSGLQIVASQSDDLSAADWRWQIFLTDNSAEFYLGTGDPANAVQHVGSIGGLTAGDWTHLAMTVKTAEGLTPGEIKLYKDGQQAGDTLAYDRPTLIDTDVDMILGNKVNGPAAWRFRGLMDDAVLLDEALSASDVATIYSSGVGALVPEPSAIVLLVGGAILPILGRRQRKS